MFWEIFIKLCAENNKKPNPVAKELGFGSSAVTYWKKGTMPNDVSLQKIANYFGVSVAYLKGQPTIKSIAEQGSLTFGNISENTDENAIKTYLDSELLPKFEPVPCSNGYLFLGSPKIYTIPVYNSLVAAFGTDLNEGIIDFRFVTLSTEEDAGKTVFATIKDNGMAPKIENGDLVQIYKTDTVESGTVAVVIVDDEDILIRTVIYGHGWTELQASNPQYEAVRFEKDEIDRIRILGKITETISVNKDE